jgi:hypothetical protein
MEKENTVKILYISIQCKKQFALTSTLLGIHHFIFFNSAHHIYGPGKNKANSESYPHFLVAAAYPTYPHPLDLLRKF